MQRNDIACCKTYQGKRKFELSSKGNFKHFTLSSSLVVFAYSTGKWRGENCHLTRNNSEVEEN